MASRPLLSLAISIGIAGALGCYTGSHVDQDLGPSGPVTSVDPTEAAEGSVTGVPCDVADVLARNCNSCHGSALSGGAPNALNTYEDLASASRTDPTKSFAELSIDRMKETRRPMPPSGNVDPADIAVLEKWIASGMPKGACAGGKSEYDTPEVCTSDSHWTRGNHDSPLMHPGVPCIDCHTQMREGPIYTIAGTLYPTAHEPDDCDGVSSSSVTVVITGADGKTLSLPVNAAGNFFTKTRVVLPYRAKIVAGGKTREMKDPAKSGDCNACHTVNGAEKAPGRVMMP